MVLEKVSSDPDPYFSSASTDEGLPSPVQPQWQARFSSLPQPVPFAGLWGYTSDFLRKAIIKEQARMQTEVLKRPLSAPEADAIAFHYAKAIHYSSLGLPVGLAAGLWRAWATRNEMRWPLIPKRLSDLSEFRFNKETEELSFAGKRILKSKWVWLAIQNAKGSAYVGISVLISSLLFASYAGTVASVGVLTDKRLTAVRDFYYAAAGKTPKQDPGKTKSGSRPAPKPDTVDPMGQGSRTAGELWKNHRKTIARTEDDASPTAGNDDFFSDGFEKTTGSGSVMNDGQMQRQERRQQPSPRQNATQNRAVTFQMEKTERQPKSFSDDYGMSDSTASDQTPTTDASSSESAWERIRRGASSDSGSATSGSSGRGRFNTEARDGSTMGDSFTFSSTDSERSYAKDEAQKHFDERVEQERRGEDFGSPGHRKW